MKNKKDYIQHKLTCSQKHVAKTNKTQIMKKTKALTVFLLLLSISVFAQNKQITGTVISSGNGLGIPGATVVLKKSPAVGTSTDIDGNFILSIPLGEDVIIVSSIGKTTKEVVFKDEVHQTIILDEDISQLDEVMVVGYGTQKKSLITGAISSITSKDIAQAGITRVDQALQGRTAGVTVMSSSGQPGAEMSIRIRGAGTNNSTAPLYVVDGFIVGSIESINPNDISSMEILKDAASAAIYGAQGANGVILITTKKGEAGETRIEYDYSFGIQNPRKYMDLLNANEYARLQNEAAFNSGKPLVFTEEQISGFGKGTNWQRKIANINSPVTNHQLSISGGTEKTKFNTSFSYLSQDGIFAPSKSNFERYTFRTNVETSLLDDILTIGTNSDVSYVDRQAIASNQGQSGPISSALNIDPITSVYDEYGDFSISPYVATEVVNPVGRIYYSHGSSSSTRIALNGFVELKLFKDLRIRSNIGTTIQYNESRGYTPLYYLNSSNFTVSSGASKSMNENFYTNFDNTLTYSKTISRHTFMGMVGNSVRKAHGTDVSASKQGLLFDDAEYAYIANAKTQGSDGAGGGLWESAFLSYFGRLNYDYENKYIFTSTFRADGSYRFGPNNRFGYFPSLSLGWNVSNEGFMSEYSWIDNLKLRLSWGQTGNDALDNWQYVSTISTYGKSYYFGDDEQYIGAAPGRTANPDLKWETSEQTNIGFDMRFLKHFSTTVDLYSKTTKDLLVVIPAPLYLGNLAPWGNAGSVNNKGVEFGLSYQKTIKKVNVNLSGNIAFNKNEVLSVGNESGYITGGSVLQMSNLLRMEPGQPIGYFWLNKVEGVFQTQDEINNHKNSEGKVIQPKAVPGDLKFKDKNDDGVIDSNDREYVGSPHPDFNYGINISLGWRNFDMNAFFNGLSGHDIFNGLRRWDLQTSNYQRKALDRWHGTGTSNSYPRVTTDDTNGNFTTPSTFFLEDGSFLRLKNLSLGYTFNNLNKFKIQSARIYTSASNLLTFTKYTGYEPEVTGGVLGMGIDRGVYPQAKTFTVGLTITL